MTHKNETILLEKSQTSILTSKKKLREKSENTNNLYTKYKLLNGLSSSILFFFKKKKVFKIAHKRKQRSFSN